MDKKIPLLDLGQLRANQIAKENKERFEKIIQKLLDVIIKEGVTVIELPVIVSMITGKVNEKINKSEIEKILNLDKNDK